MSSAPPADDDAVEHIDPENTALRSGVRLNAGGGIAAPAFWQRCLLASSTLDDALSLARQSEVRCMHPQGRLSSYWQPWAEAIPL